MNRITIQQSNVHRYNLYDGIEAFEDYEEFIEDLATFTQNDAIALYINCPGGRVDVGISLINAIRSSAAATTAIVEAPSYSMASVIALATDKLIMLDNTYLMFHNYSSGAYGKGAELITGIKHSDAHFQRMMQGICYPFLTKKELQRIQNDGDIYIYDNDDDLQKRKERHFGG